MFNHLSIRHKLIVLLALGAALALLISSAITVYVTYVSETRTSLRDLQQMAAITSENMRAALAFDDAASARKLLTPLYTNPHILLAVVYDDQGRKFSEYHASSVLGEGAESHVGRLPAPHRGARAQDFNYYDPVFAREIMGVVQPILFEDQYLGSLVLISDTEQMWSKINDFILVQALTSLLTLGLLLLLSMKLQALFTEPILTLIASMGKVAHSKNYRISLHTERKDEFAALYAGYNAMLSDICERDERLKLLATTDALTGLANRRQALEMLQTMVTRAWRKNEALGLIMLDIDHFKSVNDRYGHPVGDQVLKEVASIMQHCAREYDVVARLGGEEFLVLCDNSNLPTTTGIAERLRQEVAQRRIEYLPGQTLSVTISLGVQATIPAADASCEQLLKAVDDALYQAKAQGRNRYALVG